MSTKLQHLIKKVDIRDYTSFLNYPNKPLFDNELETFEEIFFLILEVIFGHTMPDTKEFDELFVPINFFPAFYGKDVGEGAWIRIKTDIGYNCYWAKKSNKFLSAELATRKLNRLNSKYNKSLNPKNLIEIDESLKVIEQRKSLLNEITLAEYSNAMPSKLHYIKALRTPTQWMYLLPTEYEIINDIQLYVDAVLDKQNKNAVKYKMLFTRQDHDQVFYMQSRGIPKDVAIMMCRLQQCYFEVNTRALFAEYLYQV